MALVCETVTGRSMGELLAARDAVSGADMVELRLDGVRDLDVAGALAGRRLPVIATCRASWEGGRFDGAEDERLRVLTEAARLGAEYVDVEWRADRRSFSREVLPRLVLSHHDFDGVPADLADRVRAMRHEAAGTIKVAIAAATARDCLTLKSAVDGSGACVAIAMGSAGRFTRAWPGWTNSVWTYSGTAAPGQFSTDELTRVFRVRQTTSRTHVYGITGRPLGHSASPAMHNAAFAALSLDAVYVPIESDDAAAFLDVADAVGLRGASVTAPLKRAILETCDDVDEVARAVGAVNTLKRTSSGWSGRNFDVAGFLAPLDRLAAARAGSRAVILGAGGAARGAAWALKQRGVDVAIAARRPNAGRAVAEAVGVGVADWPGDGTEHAPDLLVNSTPVGAWPASDASPIDRPHAVLAYDLVYNPTDTQFLKRARAGGAQTIGGLDMLVEQAARQFEWWTEHSVSRSILEEAARRFLGTLGS